MKNLLDTKPTFILVIKKYKHDSYNNSVIAWKYDYKNLLITYENYVQTY